MRILIAVILVLGFSHNVFAWGYSRGNGGNAILCNPDPHYHVLDFYIFKKYSPIPDGVYIIDPVVYSRGVWDDSIIRRVYRLIEFLRPYDSKRADQYEKWAASFYDEYAFVNDMPKRVARDVGFGSYLKIMGCPVYQLAVQIRDPNTKNNPFKIRYFVSQKIYSNLGMSEKATLILHELIVREMITYIQREETYASMEPAQNLVSSLLGLYFYTGTQYEQKYSAQVSRALKKIDLVREDIKNRRRK